MNSFLRRRIDTLDQMANICQILSILVFADGMLQNFLLTFPSPIETTLVIASMGEG